MGLMAPLAARCRAPLPPRRSGTRHRPRAGPRRAVRVAASAVVSPQTADGALLPSSPELVAAVASPAVGSPARVGEFESGGGGWQVQSAPALVGEVAEALEEEPGGLLWPFPLPASRSASGSAYLGLTYGYLLFTAAKLISEGSELLLEVRCRPGPASKPHMLQTFRA